MVKRFLYEDAINFACAEAYDKAIDENNIQPVDRPEIDIANRKRPGFYLYSHSHCNA